MFYLTTHSTHLQLYGFRHMVKDHSDRLTPTHTHTQSKREYENPLLSVHGLVFPISNKGSFICIILYRISHTMAFVTPVVEHWLEQEIAQWVHHE